jgi:hypothetical protein
MAGTEESPIDWRPDGSIKFDIDDVTIRWRPPKVKHLRTARNAYYEITERNKDRLAELRQSIIALADTDSEDAEPVITDQAATGMTEQLEADIAGWVRAVHNDLQLEGSLPDDTDDWPSWLVRLRFATTVTRHWGSAPFG